MKVINANGSYRIYGDNLKVYDELPAGVYHTDFSEMIGFSLSEHPNIEVKEKIYGVHEEKTNKVLSAFGEFDRNLGVILSGDKGIGKSMFAKILCVKAVQRGLPVIVVDSYVPGISRFIESVEQEAVVLFDEFDKTFSAGGLRNNDNNSPTTELLSLFDGISPGKKLFIVTCNDICRLSEFLVNRPGRFHYHFRFEYPSADEIREYLTDHLDKRYFDQIESVILFAQRVPINYDCLRSIAFELNLGVSFADAIKDLNIINIEREKYRFEIHFADGTTLHNRSQVCDMFGDSEITIPFYDRKGFNLIDAEFDPAEVLFDASTGLSVIPGDTVVISYFDEENDDAKRLSKTDVIDIRFSRVVERDIHYKA